MKKKILLAKTLCSLSKWFEIDVRIKIFGQTIFHWHYPPENSEPDNDELDRTIDAATALE